MKIFLVFFFSSLLIASCAKAQDTIKISVRAVVTTARKYLPMKPFFVRSAVYRRALNSNNYFLHSNFPVRSVVTTDLHCKFLFGK